MCQLNWFNLRLPLNCKQTFSQSPVNACTHSNQERSAFFWRIWSYLSQLFLQMKYEIHFVSVVVSYILHAMLNILLVLFEIVEIISLFHNVINDLQCPSQDSQHFEEDWIGHQNYKKNDVYFFWNPKLKLKWTMNSRNSEIIDNSIFGMGSQICSHSLFRSNSFFYSKCHAISIQKWIYKHRFLRKI